MQEYAFKHLATVATKNQFFCKINEVIALTCLGFGVVGFLSLGLSSSCRVRLGTSEGLLLLPFVCNMGIRKFPKYSDIRKIAVIILKSEQCGSTIE